MKVIKGFKLANGALVAALSLALTGCGSDSESVPAPTVDTQAPVIALNGDASVTVVFGATYTDAGATVSDNIDTGLVATVAGDTVNTSASGSYTLTYNVSDAAGNAARQVTRTVNVQEEEDSFTATEFTLISSAGEASDIQFTESTVGEWSTGSASDGDTTYEDLDAWTITSGTKTAEQGNWGTVLVFQNGIIGDFNLFNNLNLKLATSGGYTEYKVAVSANGVSKEIVLPVNDAISTWQDLSVNLADFALNVSEIDSIAVMAVGGTPSVSKIYITDFTLAQESEIVVDTETESDFVFKSSDAEVTSSLVVDEDDNSDVGNVIIGEWSTGTLLADTTYNGLATWELSAVGGWGAVLALQGDVSDGTSGETANLDNYDVDFSKYTNIKLKVAAQGDFATYKLHIGSKSGGNVVSHELDFSLADKAQWNEIDFNLDSFGIDLSNVMQIAVFGIYPAGPEITGQKLYITDFVAYDTGMPSAVKDSSDDKFVFISSSDEQVDLIVDDNNFAHDGNITINDWSTGTGIASDVDYDGLTAMELTQGAGWGTVISYAGDISGSVLPYDLDLAKYSTVNFKIAADGAYSSYEIAFVTAVGAEFKQSLTVNSGWTDVTINIADLPLNLNLINQIAIFGKEGTAGDKIYITDFNIAK